jgi:hypothetical protein
MVMIGVLRAYNGCKICIILEGNRIVDNDTNETSIFERIILSIPYI